ncbi:cobalamin-dependent protein [Eubacterium maltosivorans]|uniref:cobalamin-dependent protein n=1 Tax=Eubacterium maltosivorans TaxID=2041044 RepID=UPI00189DEEAB|nr:cobalamin-dependent protein [Eubacterium maltosivorans]
MEIKMKKRFEYKNLPDMKSILDEVGKVAADTVIGKTLFMEEKGVASEAEYKRKMAEEGHIMKHSHIGWNSWDATAKGVEEVYNTLQKRGSYVDRFGFCLDWVMGVPAEYRDKLPIGTGLTFKDPDEWQKLGQIVPVQPHLGDHMIASCNSFENTRYALAAGVTTIGNVSHYYTYEYPGVDIEEQRVIDMLKAIVLMGKFKDQGTIIHSNVDDGFGSQFHDLANLVGWCIMERYIVEELLGGRMCHCFGNLFSDPVLRMTFNQAMWEINTYKTPGSMIYGNTIDFGFDYDRNFGALSSFVMADSMGQSKCPTGHAVTPIPVTEAARVPSIEEIVQAHMTVDMMIEKGRYYSPYINWTEINAEKNLLVACGRIFFERIMNGLDDLDVDITHAGEILGALKSIGSEQLEEVFGVGKADKLAMRGRIPVRPTNIVMTINERQREISEQIQNLEGALQDVNVIIGSTDGHEFGKEIVKSILLQAGANVFDLGKSVPVQDILDTMIESESRFVVMSSFNGIALSFAREMLEGLEKSGMDAHLIMGGLLNENKDGSDLAVDVSDDLRALGVSCDNNAEGLVDTIRAFL